MPYLAIPSPWVVCTQSSQSKGEPPVSAFHYLQIEWLRENKASGQHSFFLISKGALEGLSTGCGEPRLLRISWEAPQVSSLCPCSGPLGFLAIRRKSAEISLVFEDSSDFHLKAQNFVIDSLYYAPPHPPRFSSLKNTLQKQALSTPQFKKTKFGAGEIVPESRHVGFQSQQHLGSLLSTELRVVLCCYYSAKLCPKNSTKMNSLHRYLSLMWKTV